MGWTNKRILKKCTAILCIFAFAAGVTFVGTNSVTHAAANTRSSVNSAQGALSSEKAAAKEKAASKKKTAYHWRKKLPRNYTGLAQEKNGTWYYLVKGKPDFKYSNLVLYYGKWFYVHNGIIDWTYSTIAQVNGKGTWYYVRGGQIDWGYTGLAKARKNRYFIQNGVVNRNYSGLCYHAGSWWYVKKGIVDPEYYNLVLYNGTWYFVRNGKVDRSITTLAQVNGTGAWYYVTNGRIDWNYTGLFNYFGTYYYIQNGTLNWGYSGLVFSGAVWYYVKNGTLDTSFKGLCEFYGDYYYINNGKIDWNYNGTATIPGYGNVEVRNGKVPGGSLPISLQLTNKSNQILNANGRNLWTAYQWSIMPWTVYDVNPDYGVAHYAEYGLNNHHGNCYVMAATFVTMARALGYEAYQMSGAVPSMYGGLTPHSWAEVKMEDGQWYVVDPDFASESGGNGFLFHYGTSGTWRYADYYRMHN